MPDPLINATIDLHAERIDRETWISLIAARRGYRIMPQENADADGYQVVTVLHPNIWYGHGPGQVRAWLDNARRAGSTPSLRSAGGGRP